MEKKIQKKIKTIVCSIWETYTLCNHKQMDRLKTKRNLKKKKIQARTRQEKKRE